MEENRLQTQALAWPEKAKMVHIFDRKSYNDAALMVTQIVDLRKRVVEHHKPIKDAAYAAHKAAVAAENKLLVPLQQAEVILKRGIAAWDTEQDRLRRQRQVEMEAAQRKMDEDARLAIAAEAERNGASEETIKEILETEVIAPVVVHQPTYKKSNNISTSQRWHAEVVDMRLLCDAIVQGKASVNLVKPDMAALNSMARAMKGTMNIPGVKAVSETSVAVR